MDTVSLLRDQLRGSHEWLENTVSDVTAEQADWSPPGKANPLGATYAHVLMGEDMIVNGLIRGQAPLMMGGWAGKAGLSEPPPAPGQDWNEWARKVRVDLSAARQYAQAVYAATDEYLASLKDADLERLADLSAFQLGKQTVGWVLGNIAVTHVRDHCGEISCLKGLQGAKGYPF